MNTTAINATNYIATHHVNSIQFSHSVMSDSLWSYWLQHSRLPCPSPTLGVYSNSCSLIRWCHEIISSSVIPFSSCPQSFPASGSFQMSQLFVSGGQSIRVSASTLVLPMNIQDWFPLGWTGWISKITADGDCSHEIKRRLLLGRKAMANIDNILKIRGITLPTKVCLVKEWFFQ